MDPHGAARRDESAAWSHGSYADLASEYYNEELHPTSAALGSASVLSLRRLAAERQDAGQLLEVGAGRGSLGDLRDVLTWQRALVSDVSLRMLSSARGLPYTRSAQFVLLNAQRLGVRAASIDTILASLADPYSSRRFWNEVARCLRPDGAIMWTSPSYEWASHWRQKSGEPSHRAIFELQDGERVAVPSVVLPLGEQLCVIEQAGLRVKIVDQVALREVQLAKDKLTSVLPPDGPVVTGILAIRP